MAAIGMVPYDYARADASDIACGLSAAAGTFGGCLSSIDSKLQGLIQSFENSGKALEAGLGGQIATNVALARAQFGAELDKQMLSVSVAAQNFAVSTTSQIQRLEAQTVADARTLTKDVLDTASLIPFTRRDPSVRPLANPYYAPLPTGALRLVLDGHFLDASKDGYQPIMNVDNDPERYAANANSTDQLEFSLPYTALTRKGNNPNAVEYRQLTLTVPFVGNHFYCVADFLCKESATFRFKLVTLPQSPGQLVITKKRTVPAVTTKNVSSAEQFQDSKDNDILEDKSGKLYCFAPQDAGPGWRISPARVKGRVTQVVEGKEGTDWWWVSNPDSQTSIANACVRLETLHKTGWGHSGKIKFVVDYVEEHDSTSDITTDVPVTIGWGGSQVVQLAAGESWVGKFTQFDGKVYAFADGNIGTPFLNLSISPITVTLSFVGQSP
jgi:hypothetical protein